MRFEINGKVLADMIKKISKVIPKRSSVPSLQRIYFRCIDGQLVLSGSDSEQYLSVREEAGFIDTYGDFAIDISDIKPFTKEKRDIIIESDENRVSMICGKKRISVNSYLTNDEFTFGEIKGKTLAFQCQEDWLLETLKNLTIFTDRDGSYNHLLKSICFNPNLGKAIAVDGYRIGMRDIPNSFIKENKENVLILNHSVSVLSNLLDKKGGRGVDIYDGNNFTIIEGVGYTHIQRKPDGKFIQIEKLMDFLPEYKFTLERNEFQSKLGDIKDLYDKECHKPLILDLNRNMIKTSYTNFKYHIEDEIEVQQADGKIRIGFNPMYLLDVCNVAEGDTLECAGTKKNAPLSIKCEDYLFIVLPVAFTENKAA